MAWTTPRTWVDGEAVSQSEMNAHIRDNMDFLFTASTKPDQNAQTGTGSSAYTFVLADATGGKIVLANAASSATYTVPQDSSVAWPAGSVIRVVSIGAGVITFAAGAGATVNNTAATLSQYESATLVKTAANTWQVIKGGGLPKASVSATTGSPGVDTSSRPGKTIYSFTGTGSITTTAGSVELLVVGGGGGGGKAAYNGGGGGGDVISVSTFYLPAGTHTVTVGGGGAQTANGDYSGVGGVVAIGGAGGPNNTRGAGNAGGNGSGGGDIVQTGGASLSGGYAGGQGGTSSSGGGGGAGAVGSAGAVNAGGNGGNGESTTIRGSSETFGGGGGGTGGSTHGSGGTGGGGGGSATNGTAGGTNTGGGGGAGQSNGGAGGSGLVVIVVG